jgi:hypothetical protein
MRLLTDLLPHLFLYGLAVLAGVFVLVVAIWTMGIIFSPVVWISDKLLLTKCPKCNGFFRRKLMSWEAGDEREVLRTVNRVDQGVVYSNRLLEPNHTVEINRKEQVVFTERTILNHWACKDPMCAHQWDTEEISEYEGSLGRSPA